MKLFTSQDKTPSRPSKKAFPFGESGTRHRKRFPLLGEWHTAPKKLSPSGRVARGTENAFPFGESGTKCRERRTTHAPNEGLPLLLNKRHLSVNRLIDRFLEFNLGSEVFAEERVFQVEHRQYRFGYAGETLSRAEISAFNVIAAN